MIQSMTGFGKAVTELPNRKITVEIKSLNSKQLDLSTRIPAIYREKEMDIRAEVGRRLERGKIDFNIYVESLGRETSTQINQPIIENYYNQIKDVSKNIGIPLPSDWFQVLLRLPDAIKTEITELEEEETEALMQTVNRALDQLQECRIQEG